MLILLSIIAGLCAVMMAMLFIASGIFSSPKYLEPWKKSYAQRFDDPRIRLAAHGLLAANGHNMQPWKIRLDRNDPSIFYLYADSDRLTPEVDPYARQTMVSQGTFLEYVRVAGEQLGYATSIQLFPDGAYDERKLAESMRIKPVARIVLTKSKPEASSLFRFMFMPDTNRAAYRATALTPEQTRELLGIPDDPGITLQIFEDEDNLKKLGHYAIEGARIESGIHRINEESANIFRANEYKKNRYRYGFSVEGQGTSGFMKHVLQGLVTLFPSMNGEKASADRFVKSTQTAVDHTPAYAMIISRGNTRVEQVKSGMLYSRLILTAHGLGLVLQPPSQVLEEYPEMSGQYHAIHREYAPEGSTIQMFVRLGKATRDFPLSMRRDVMDLIER